MEAEDIILEYEKLIKNIRLKRLRSEKKFFNMRQFSD